MLTYLLSLLLLVCPISAAKSKSHVHEYLLNASVQITVKLDTNTISLFCFQPPNFIQWITHCLNDFHIALRLDQTDDFTASSLHVFDGLTDSFISTNPITSCNSLDDHLPSSKSSYFLSFLFPSDKSATRVRHFTFSTLQWIKPSFPPTCFAVCSPTTLPPLSSSDRNQLIVHVSHKLNVRNIVISLVGLVLLLSANFLSTTLSFYYFSGVSFVLLGSVLILFIIFIRFLPLRRGGTVLQSIFVLLGGTFSLIFMFIDYMRSSVLQLLTSNIELTLIYLVSVTFLSLLVFYWFHLPERLVRSYPRTKTIMNYFLRILGAILLLSSLHMPFVEEEILSKSFSHFLSLFNFTLEEANPILQMTEAVSPKIVRLLLAFSLLLCMDLFKVCLHLFRRNNFDSQGKKYDVLDSHGRDLIDVSPNTDKPYLPGSPWASSSPYYYAHPSQFQSPVRRSTDIGFVHRTPTTNQRVATPDRDVSHRRWSSVNAFAAYPPLYAADQQAQVGGTILTDDESDD